MHESRSVTNLPTATVDPPAGRSRRFSRRATIAAAAVLAVVGTLAYVRFVRQVEVRAHRVERGDVTALVFGRGTIESRREAQLGFDLVGRVSDVLVDEGDAIALGQTLAHLAPEQFEAELRTASSDKAAAQAAIRRLDVDLRRAREALAFAESEERRMRGLAESDAIPTRDLDLATEQTLLARAGVDRAVAQRAEATRALATAGGHEAERRVVTLRSALVAPFDGIVVRRFRDPGDVVTVGATVLRVVATDRLWARAWVDETTLRSLTEGQPVEVALPGHTATGRLDRIGREADRQTHEIAVEVALDEVPERVALGQRADVWIEVDRRVDVVRIPIGFLRHDEGGSFCYLARDGRIARVRVTTGVFGRDQVEIVSGLAAGDVVLDALEPGATLPLGRRFAAAGSP
jgi:HlyD family secretion protein